MKKIFILSLLFVSTSVLAAPSVRTLGNKPVSTLAGQATNKITPTKTSNVSESNAGAGNAARLGTLRVKNPTGAISGAVSRFPVITPSVSYNSATGEPEIANIINTSNIDVDTIINTVNNNISSQYYNKNQVYNNSEFVRAVKDVDDPRIDAIRVGSRPYHATSLDSNYVYIWIEE